jgi:hypothetical protein
MEAVWRSETTVSLCQATRYTSHKTLVFLLPTVSSSNDRIMCYFVRNPLLTYILVTIKMERKVERVCECMEEGDRLLFRGTAPVPA